MAKRRQTSRGFGEERYEQLPLPRAVAETRRPTTIGHVDLTYWAFVSLAALVFGFVIYSPALQGPFVLDDLYQFFGRPEASVMPFMQWIAGVRPLLNVTFWLNYQAGGTDTAGYHATNVLIHVAASMVVLLVVRGIWRRAGGRGEWQPLAVAGIFLVHPLQTESVAYISSRSESLSVLFAYLALAVQLGASQPALSVRRIGVVLVLLCMAVLTKEHTAAMPAVLMLTDYFWRGGWTTIRANWKMHAALSAGGLAALGFVGATLNRAGSAGFGLKDLPSAVYLLTQLRLFWRYVRMLVLPVGLNADPDLRLSHTLADPWVMAGVAGIVAVLVAAWMLRDKAPLGAFGIVVFMVLLAPTSSFIPILDVFAEHRVYFPFLGVCCLVLEGLRRWSIPRVVVVAALALLAFGSWQRNAVWASSTALWSDAVAGSPAKYRPRFQLAYAKYAAGDCAGAVNEFVTASKLAPGNGPADPTLVLDWALALDCAGQPDAALARFYQAAALQDSAHVRSLIAMVYGRSGQYDKAFASLDAAQKLDPGFAMTYAFRGNVYAAQKRLPEARMEYQRALALDPTNTAAVQALISLGGQ